MKKHIYIVLVFSLVSVTLQAQKNIYQNINFTALSKNHKTLAIIPFSSQVNLSTRVDQQTKHTIEINEGNAVQNALESYFLKIKKRKKFSIDFQNIEKTNTLLAKHKIDANNLDTYSTEELCQLLGVDVIISGNIDLNVLLSHGVKEDDFSLMEYFIGKRFGKIAIKMSDGTTGKLLWKYEKDIDRKTGKNTQELIDVMMRSAGRKFPYEND